jgi:TctA family transporter
LTTEKDRNVIRAKIETKKRATIYMEISLFDAAARGFLDVLHLKVFLAMMIGVSIGTFTAVAPQGLGMPLVYAIALPIVIKWEPITGIALLIGASSVSAICAAYLPILSGIPGGSGSQATVLDGYPMGKRGEGGVHWELLSWPGAWVL